LAGGLKFAIFKILGPFFPKSQFMANGPNITSKNPAYDENMKNDKFYNHMRPIPRSVLSVIKLME